MSRESAKIKLVPPLKENPTGTLFYKIKQSKEIISRLKQQIAEQNADIDKFKEAKDKQELEIELEHLKRQLREEQMEFDFLWQKVEEVNGFKN